MVDYRIVASDLDGTLLNSSDFVSEENWAAIAEMKARGVHFVPCTGRTLNEMDPLIRDNSNVRYIIHSDGAVVYDKETDRRITACMGGEEAKFVFDTLFTYDVHATVRHERYTYIDERKSNLSGYAYYHVDASYRDRICERFAIKQEDFEAFCKGLDQVEMICVFFRNEGDAETCIKRIRETGNYITARFTPYCYEIFHKTAGKGNALLRLADALGLSHAQTIGVGDSENDLTMLEAAGLGLCMSNGMDEAKRAADEIICNNDEHAMKYILEHYL